MRGHGLLPLVALGLTVGRPALGQQPETPAAGGELDEQPRYSAADKQKSKEHFLRGVQLLGEQAWAPALAEFKLSRELFPTRVATNNAAIALSKLERYDEALALFEALLREFKLPAAERDAAQRRIAELHLRVGTIEIRGAEPGAAIVVSGIDRGEYPPVEPIRVPAGNHVVRVAKPGYQPFETRVDVAGAEVATVDAKLPRLTDSGRLSVIEKAGRTVKVYVDNVAVGVTPWTGTLGVGSHVVALGGPGKLGSQPTQAVVRSQALTSLALVAEPLEASLRVNPTPPGAAVWINGVDVGNGVWLGRLKAGRHKVELKSDGFLGAARTIDLQKGQREVLDVELERDEDAPVWRKPAKWTVAGDAGVLLVPTFGGDVAGDCGEGCERALGLGAAVLVRGTYELGSGLGFGLELGGLHAVQQVDGRAANLLPHGFSSPSPGSADDGLRLTGLLAGAVIGYHIGDSVPVLLTLGAGVMHGQLRDERSGRYVAQNGGDVDAYALCTFQPATYLYLDPAVRVGLPLREGLELSAQLGALMLIGISQPRWDGTLELAAGSDGIASYPDDALLGSFVVGLSPGLSLRYAAIP
jgi:hypothetical protein